MNLLEGKVIVVTGGAGLLGRAFCQHIAENGATAVVASRDVEKSEEVIDALKARSPADKIICRHLDITEPESVAALFKNVQDQFGRVDAVVNNALPITPNYGRKFEDVEYDDFCENISAHIGGYFLVCQEAVRHFTLQGHGNIVNIGSIYGTIAPRFGLYEGTGMTKEVEYAVSKAAIVQLTQYLAAYCKGRNIRVNCLSPGGIYDNQPQEFVGRYNTMCLNKGMLEPGEVAGTLIHLLSDEAKYINGQNIVVDDGFVIGS